MFQKSKLVIFLVLSLGFFSTVAIGQKKHPQISREDAQLKQLTKENEKLKKQLRIKQLAEENAELLRQLGLPAPANGQPANGQPANGQPANGQPANVQPANGQPANGQPANVQPANSQPANGQPVNVQPANGQPANGQPANVQPANGQPASGRCSLLDKLPLLELNICYLAMEAVSKNNSLKNTLGNDKTYLEAVFAQNAKKLAIETALVHDSEKRRTDKQIGSGPNNSGSTSLAVKGGGPAIIGWAIENGAATSKTNGNTVTVQVNPYNLGRALFRDLSLPQIRSFARNGIAQTMNVADVQNPTRWFDPKKLYFSLSFDTSRGTTTPMLTATKQQISAWSVRYEFINHRNPLDPIYDDPRDAYFKTQQKVGTEIVEAVKKLFIDPDFKSFVDKWIADADVAFSANDATCAKGPISLKGIELVAGPCIDQAYDVIASQLSSFPMADVLKHKNVADLFALLDEKTAAFAKKRNDFLDEVNRGAIATFEYTNHREVNSPDTSNFRFIWEKGVYGKVDFTINADLTMFNKKPAAMNIKRIRDYNFALQFDRPMNDVLPFGNTIFSGAFRFTRQTGDVVLPNGVVASGTKGDIAFGQLKLTIPFGETGLKIPFSVTFGNRSEFVKERFIRGNFGLTLDLDQIFKGLSIPR